MAFVDLVVLLGIVSATSVWVDRRFIRNRKAADSQKETSKQVIIEDQIATENQ